MLGRVSSTHLRSIIIQVCSSSSSLSSLSYHLHTSSASATDFASPSTSSEKLSNTHLESPQLTIALVGDSVLSKCSSLLDHKDDNFIGSTASVNELLLSISHVSPGTCRKYLRVSRLKPEHVLEILVGFQLGSGKLPFDAKIVKSLWAIFKRVADENDGFKHLPRSCEVMASMLIGSGMLREVESLLLSMERQGISVVSDEIFSGMIEGYANAGELERALLLYDKMKVQCVALSLSCYGALLDLLMKNCKAVQALSIYEDLVENGFEFTEFEARNLEILIQCLSWDGKIKEARKLLKKVVATGWEPSTAVLSEVANVYWEKKDFEDLLSFFVEMKSVPDIIIGNKIIFSLSKHFSIERADSFLWDLETLGFIPDKITLGILISWSCRDGKLRDAFKYLSEMLRRGLKPDRHSYNALISGLLKVGMEELAGDIRNEMIDNGIEPNLATCRALLAGYSKARRFKEVKVMISEMANRGLISMSPLEDPISKAFAVLGLDPSKVKIKRDNDVKNFRTEFVDELGNGLYLETNLDEFEITVSNVLEESLIPDFNLLVMRQCNSKNVKGALLVVDEMLQWGQEISLHVLNVLVRLLCDSNSQIKALPGLLDKFSWCFGQLGEETLNLLVHALMEKGFEDKCSLLLYEMRRRHIPIANTTYTAALVRYCKVGRLSDMRHYWSLAMKDNWLPECKDSITIFGCLCERRMLKELFELFDVMLASKPNLGMQVCDVLVEKLCCARFTGVAHILVNELEHQHLELDHTIYSHLIKGYCQEKRSSKALKIFDTIQADKMVLSSDALLPLIPTLSKAGRVENVRALRDICLRDHPFNLSLYTAFIDGFFEAENIAEADALLMDLLSKNVVPDDEIYNRLLQGHCRNKDMETVKKLLCLMIRSSITFSASSYRDLVHLMCRKGMFHSAFGMKRLMLVEGMIAYSIIYNILIFYLSQMGKCSLVESLLHELQETGLQLDQVGYNFVIHGFSIGKDTSKSVKYLNDMMSKGFRPSNRSLRTVMCYWCSRGKVEDALQLSNQIELRGWVHCSTVQHALLHCLISYGRIHQAERFLARIIEKGLIPNTVNYDSLLRKFCQYRRLETAVNLLDEMLKMRSIPDSTSYDCIVQSLCAHNLDRAVNFYNEMLERKLKPSIGTWDVLIHKFCADGRAAEAERLLISMVKVGETPTKRMYSSVIDRYRFESNLSKASEVLQKMQQHGYEPDFMTQWSLISSLSNDQEDCVGTQGFLSKLLLDSGFPSESGTKFKQR